MDKQIEYKMVVGTVAYRVGTDGSVWSRLQHGNPNENGRVVGAKYLLGQWKPLRLSRNRTGYLRAAIFKDGIQCKRMVHRLILEAFVGPCPPGMNACHTDDNRENNTLSNLRWDYPQGNWVDRKRNGRHHSMQGEQHPMAKLTAMEINTIRCAVAAGESSSILAVRYGVAYGTIRSIIRKRTWKHLESLEPRLTNA